MRLTPRMFCASGGPNVSLVLNGESNTGGHFALTSSWSIPGNVTYVEYSPSNSNSGIVTQLVPRPTTNIFGPSLFCGKQLSGVCTSVNIAQAEEDSQQVVNWLPGGTDIYHSLLLPACSALVNMQPGIKKVFLFASHGDAEMQLSSPTGAVFDTRYRTLLADIRAQFTVPVTVIIDLCGLAYKNTLAFSPARWQEIRDVQDALAADPTLAPITSLNNDDLSIASNHFTEAGQTLRGQRLATIIQNYF